MANLNSLWDNDICFCGNDENCPKRDECLRSRKDMKPGIYTMALLYDPNKEECEYFIERNN